MRYFDLRLPSSLLGGCLHAMVWKHLPGSALPKRTLIANFAAVSWKSRVAIFLAVFSFLWLLLAPLSSFQLGTSVMSSLGVWGYLCLFLFSGISTAGYEVIRRQRIIGEMSLLPINITLTETGTRHYLNAPRDMKTGIFIRKFIDTLPDCPQDSVLSRTDMFDLSLIVITPETQFTINPLAPFSEFDLPDNTALECKILGRIKEPWTVTQLRALNLARPVEIAICLDVTGSMTNVIDDLKTNLSDIYENIANEYKKLGITIYDVRVKIIAFRDFYHIDAPAMEISPFYYLPNQKNVYQSSMESLPAIGGGDTPESSLEALAVGIMSEWDNTRNKNQLVVLITDAPPHPLEMNLRNKPENYPANIPLTIDGLRDVWESGTFIKNAGKKLLLVAPDCPEWEIIYKNWTMVWFVDFAKLAKNKESISAYVARLISESMVDTERVA